MMSIFLYKKKKLLANFFSFFYKKKELGYIFQLFYTAIYRFTHETLQTKKRSAFENENGAFVLYFAYTLLHKGNHKLTCKYDKNECDGVGRCVSRCYVVRSCGFAKSTESGSRSHTTRDRTKVIKKRQLHKVLWF